MNSLFGAVSLVFRLACPRLRDVSYWMKFASSLLDALNLAASAGFFDGPLAA